ncbi:MAG: outer membrane lipoprotein carrier protein LolA [Deltaproteobacteria bacterium]|nr:outer membrane lipoprotein carrier protein LolA [Deltaproteobacteria bacterium]
MVRRLIMLIILGSLFQGVSLADESLVTILEGIKKTYGRLPGLCVPYTREVITRSMSMLGSQARGDMASGKIYFKYPHFLRLEQKEPKQETIIANNDTLWWYIPDRKCAYRYPAKDFGKELRLLGDIFQGLAHVEDNFQVILHGRNPSGEYDIELIPDPPWQEIDRITVTANPHYEIRAIKIHNPMGSVTLFTLGRLSEEKDFEEGFFQFLPPEGVRLIIEGPGQ